MRLLTLRTLVSTVALALALVVAAPANADKKKVNDGDDVAGPLDIDSATHAHAGSRRVTHTIRMHDAWTDDVLGAEGNALFVLFNLNRNTSNFERYALIVAIDGVLRAAVLRRDGTFVGSAGVSRPNDESVKVTVRERHLGNPSKYGWNAQSVYTDAGECAAMCRDFTPNGGWTIHRNV